MEKEGKFLVKRHAFGARGDVRGALGWLDEGTLMYPVGKAIALHTISTNNQRFVEASYQSTGVTALAVSTNKKFVAVAEGGENPQIQIIDTTTRKRRKVLMVPELGSDRFTAMAFSADGRHLVTQGGAPGWNLFYWNWERSKPLASVSLASTVEQEHAVALGLDGSLAAAANHSMNSVRLNGLGSTGSGGMGAGGGGTGIAGGNSGLGPLVTNVAVCPADALTITVSGIGLLRYYRYTDGVLQPLPNCRYPQEQQEVFLTHTWLDGDRLVASTKRSGDLVLIEKGRFIGRILVPRHTKNYTAAANDGVTVTSLAATKNGFVAGSSNGAVSVYALNSSGTAAVLFSSGATSGQNDSGDGALGDLENAEEDKGATTHLYERLCTIYVPEREPGEPTDLTPHRDPNMDTSASRVGPQSRSGVGNQNNSRLGGQGDGNPIFPSGGNSISLGATATLTRSGKPRRFRVAPPQSSSGGDGGGGLLQFPSTGEFSGNVPSLLPLGSAQGLNSTDGDGSSLRPNTGSGDGGGGGRDSAHGSAPTLAQDAALGLMGLASNKLPHGVASMALDQGEENLAVLTNAGKIYALDFRQHWAQVQRDISKNAALTVSDGSAATLSGAGASASASAGAGAGGATAGTADANGVRRASAGLSGSISNTHSAPVIGIPAFEPVCEPFHTGPINGLACSVRKPFLLTSGSDHSVRLWNTSTHKMEMCVFFKEEPRSVALHPSGLMAIICFPDCVRVMSVLWNSLRDRKTINFRHASDVAFSHGGHFFTITHGNLVDVFNSATCEPHGQLRGHPQKVKDLKWCSTSPYPTDNRLITCSLDGMIVYWSSQDLRKEAEHSDNKRYQYLAVAADDRYVWTVGAPTSAMALEVQWKVTLREMDRHVLGSANASSEDYEFTDTAITSLLVASHQRMLFGGGDDGSLKVMTLPLPTGVQEAPLSAHSARITRMALSHDESTLFTAGADGSIFFWELREDASRAALAAATGALSRTNVPGLPNRPGDGAGGGDGFQYGTNEVLVTQQELEEQRVEVESLQQQIEKLRTDIDSEEKRRNHEQGTRMRERMEEYRGDAATLASEYAALWNTKAEQERAFVAIKLEKETDLARDVEQSERTHQSEVQELEELCNDLQYTLEKEQSQHAQDLESLQQTITDDQRSEKERYTDLVTQRHEVLERLTRQATRARQTNQETLHQLELDTDAESLEVGGSHQKELNVLREQYLHMKGEGAIMRKNASRMEREIDVRAGEIRLLDSAKGALAGQLAELSQKMGQLHQDIDERDVVIGEREKTIYALKKQNQELEKYKFVLDHRIRQLKAQMEPRQREILQHNRQIKTRNSELESLHEGNLTLRKSIEDLKKDLAEQQQYTKQLIKSIKDFDTYKSQYLRDVGDIAPALQEPKQLQEVIAGLYNTHVVSRGGERIAAANPLIRKEFQDQLEYLSTSVGALRKKVKADQERHKREVSTMMTENLSLIREIQSLRSEIHELRIMITSEEAARRARGTGGRRAGGRAGVVPVDTDGDSAEAAAAVSAAFNSTEDSTTQTAAASVSATTTPRPQKANPMPSASSLHAQPPPPRSANSYGRHNSNASTTANSAANQKSGAKGGKSGKGPEPPKAIEENRMELRMLRAYIEVLEKALAEVQRPASGVQRLPPINPEELL